MRRARVGEELSSSRRHDRNEVDRVRRRTLCGGGVLSPHSRRKPRSTASDKLHSSGGRFAAEKWGENAE
jgi:hypothetical protein